MRIKIDADALFGAQEHLVNEQSKAKDSLRVVEAIQEEIGKHQTKLTSLMLSTEDGKNLLTPEFTQTALEIQNLKEEHRDLNNSFDNMKIKIEPYTFAQYADPFEGDDGFEYDSGSYMRSSKFSHTGGEYSIQEAEDIVLDLDKQNFKLHKSLSNTIEANKSSNIYEGVQGISNVTRTEQLISEFDNYPKLFTYLVKNEAIDEYGNQQWTNYLTMDSHTTYGYSVRANVVDDKGNPIHINDQGWYGKESNLMGNHVIVDSPFLDSRVMEKGTNIRSFTYEGFPAGVEHPNLNDQDGRVSEAYPVHKQWGEWWSGEYSPVYAEGTRRKQIGDRTDVLYNREKAIVEKMVDMQWLLLQKHKILCQTDGNHYCDLLQGESRNEDLFMSVIENDNRIFEVEQKIHELGGGFDNMKDVMSSSLGFENSDDNFSSEDVIKVQLNLLNKAMDNLKKEAASQNDLYITQDMIEFVEELRSDPDALLQLFDQIVGVSEPNTNTSPNSLIMNQINRY